MWNFDETVGSRKRGIKLHDQRVWNAFRGDLSTLTNLDIMRKIKFQERSEGTREKRECGHACGVTDKGLSLSLLVWVGWVEWILQIAFNVTLTAGEYVQFILMETYRNITSALPTTNWLFKPIPPHYRLSNCARDYSSTIRNYNASYRRTNSTNSLFYIRYVWKYKTWI